MSKCYSIEFVSEEFDTAGKLVRRYDVIYVSANSFVEAATKFDVFNDDEMKTMIGIELMGVMFDGRWA